jgi:hypothetical protein
MLFEYILAVLALVISQAVICYLFFGMGYKAARGERMKNVSETVKKPLKTLFGGSKDEKKWRTVLDNIENYDGTAQNQKEIR